MGEKGAAPGGEKLDKQGEAGYNTLCYERRRRGGVPRKGQQREETVGGSFPGRAGEGGP